MTGEVGETYQFPGQKSGTVPLTFCYKKINVQASLPTASHSTATVNETWPVLTAAVLPNGTEWRFTYDLFGQVSSVTMPTGATVTYGYNKGYTTGLKATRLACGNPPGEPPVSGSPVWPFSNLMSSRTVTSRTLTVTNPDGTTYSQPWVYTINIGSGWQGSSDSGTVTVTDPLLNDTVHTYSLNFLGQGSYGQPICGPYETNVDYYQGPSSSGAKLKTVSTQYTYTGVDHANPTNFSNYIAIGVLPASVTTTLYYGTSSSQVRQDTYTYDNGGKPFGTYQDYKGSTYPFSFGQKTAATESDWGTGTPGSVLRTSYYMNQWQSNWNYYAANLIDLPCLATTFQGVSSSSPATCAVGSAPSSQAQTGYAYDQSPSPAGALGNVTSVTRWLTTGSPVSKTTYNPNGMPTYKYDPIGNPTQFIYDASGLYPKEIIYPKTGTVSHIEYFTYDDNTGQLLSHTDQNGNKTSFQYDSMRRLTQTTYPVDGGTENFRYNDPVPPGNLPLPSFVFSKTLTGSSTFSEQGLADSFGRKYQSQITSDPEGAIYADTRYDLLGRVASQSNPYRSIDDPTYGVTAFGYDALGRKVIQQQPDGSQQQWCYLGQIVPPPLSQTNCNLQLAKTGGSTSNGSWVDFEDESGNDWQRNSDGLGRLTSVMEPNGTQAAPPLMQTSYTYNAVGDLLTVAQTGYGSDSPRAGRSFTYDTLSRLLTSVNPESGTTQYTYDLDGNLRGRTQPLVNATSGTENINYCYDALNRKTAEYTGSIVSGCSAPSQISSANLLSAYTYDATALGTSPNYPIGHLTDEIEYTSTTSVWERSPYQFDTMGQLKNEQQCAFGSCTKPYPFAYTYDYAGNVTSTTNGLTATPITLSYAYDSVARLSAVTSATPTTGIWAGTGFPSSLYTVHDYGPAGVTSAYYGSSSSTPIDLSRAYDNRMRLSNNIVYSSSTPLPSAKVTLACVTTGCPSFSGSVSVTVGGVPTAFVSGSTLSAVASNLVTAINSTDGINATATSAASGAKYVVTITSLIYGADGEASLSASVSNGATFTATTSAAKLTGDKDTISYQYSLGYAPNNNVTSANDSINGNWTYLYDTLNRLVRAQATTAGVVISSVAYKTQCWNYDSFGNRTGEGEVVAKTTCPSPLTKAAHSAWTTYTTGNKVIQSTESGTTATYAFDGAGNVLNDGVNRYAYDLDGRICAVQNLTAGSAITQYVYDAEGRRVAKGTITTWPAAGAACAAPTAANTFSLSGSGAALYLRGAKGDQDTETDGSGNWRHTNVFAGGGLTATYATGTTATLSFNFSDWLGSKRLQASSAGVTQNSWASDPYGDYLLPLGTGADATEHHFTGKESDTESGNDYFGARYYASTTGRWMSPDPLTVQLLKKDSFLVHLNNPQSWDKYSYVGANPLNSVDPIGLDTYVVLYTTGNSIGQDEITRSAQTQADEIRKRDDFDPKEDTVILKGVKSREDFVNALKAANTATEDWGPIAELDTYSHSGFDGLSFHEDSAKGPLNPNGVAQMSDKEISSLPKLNWEQDADANFYGCHTAHFASEFAKAEQVKSFGSSDFMYFSSNPNHFEPDKGKGGSLYERSFSLPHQIHGWLNQAEKMNEYNPH